MRTILTEELIDIPEKVEIDFKSRNITVKGPLGILKRSFKHTGFDIVRSDKKNQVRIQMWLAQRKQKACVNTIASHIKNMVKGVTDGFRFKMRFAYAHFPIQCNITNGGKVIAVQNFIGERYTRRVEALEGVTITKKDDVKDEIQVFGNDLNNVSLTCALINQCVKVRNKDIRQFLDGIYVSEKRLAIKE